MLRCLLILIFLHSIAGISTLTAQDTSNARGVTIKSLAPKIANYKNTYAIIVGISAYDKYTPLKYADDDASLFEGFLRSEGGGKVPAANIKTYLNKQVTTGAVTAECFQWLNSKKPGKGDRIYFFLAGHGDAYRDKYFFFTCDADSTTGPRNYRIQGNIPIGDLRESLEDYTESGAEVFFIVDACRYSDESDKARAERFSRITTEKFRTPGFYTMYSTQNGQVAYESSALGNGHGLFSYFLVQALLGKADAEPMVGDNNGLISLNELGTWVKLMVQKKAKELNLLQLPQYCCSEDDLKELFVVNKEFLHKYEKDEAKLNALFASINTGELNKTGNADRAGKAAPAALIKLFNSCVSSIKEGKLLDGENSAWSSLQQMQQQYANEELTLDARLTLTTQLINFTKAAIYLYLTGNDMDYVAENKFGEAEMYQLYKRVSKVSFARSAEHLEKAIELLGDSKTIIQQLEPKLWFLKARSYFDIRPAVSLNDAIVFAQKALAADTNSVHLYHLLAMLEMQKDRNSSKAEEYFVKAFNGETEWSKAGIEIGYRYYKLRMFDDASLYYRLGNMTNEHYAVAYNNLALAYKDRGNWNDAEKFFTLALEKKPGDKIIRNNTGILYHRLAMQKQSEKKYLEAEYYFNMGIKVKPAPELYNNLGNLYSDLEQYAAARNIYLAGIAFDNKFPQLYTNLATLYYNSQFYDSAIYYSKQCMQVAAVNSALYINAENRIKKSEYYLGRIKPKASALMNNGANPFIIDTAGNKIEIARKMLAIHQYNRAEKYLLQAINEKPQDGIALFELARFYVDQNKFKEAEPYLTRASQALDKDCNTQLLLAKLFVGLNKADEAVAIATKCYQQNNFHIDAALVLGEAYEKLKDMAKAESTYLGFYYRSRTNRQIVQKLYEFYLFSGNAFKAEEFRKELVRIGG
jgi:tetratricopeptide (TPR) repeat protein